MSNGQVKKYSVRLYFLECPVFFGNRTRLYFLECPVLFGNRTSKNLGVLVRRTSE